MGELKLHLPDELDERFRKTAMRVHGYCRGSISKAAIEALTKWCHDREPKQTQPEASSKEERPIPPRELDKSSEARPAQYQTAAVSELDSTSATSSHAQD